MFILKGTLVNIFETPKGKTKDGEEYGGDSRLQVMHETTLRNGEKRVDLVELAVADVSPYREHLSKPVSVPVAVSVWQGKLSIKAAV